MSNHVPPPYKIAEYLEHQGWAIIETVERGNDLPDKGYAIGIIYDAPSLETARFVVRACSVHDRLVRALTMALRASDSLQVNARTMAYRDYLRKSLALAIEEDDDAL